MNTTQTTPTDDYKVTRLAEHPREPRISAKALAVISGLIGAVLLLVVPAHATPSLPDQHGGCVCQTGPESGTSNGPAIQMFTPGQP